MWEYTILRTLKKSEYYFQLAHASSILEQGELTKKMMIDCEMLLTKNQKLDLFHQLRQWYRMSALFFPNLGFDIEFSHSLDEKIIPGNEKGKNVKNEKGRISNEEFNRIKEVIINTPHKSHRELAEKTALALCLVTGKNTSNYCLTLEDNYVTTKNKRTNKIESYILFPRIKKRSSPFKSLHKVRIPSWVASFVELLITENHSERIPKLSIFSHFSNIERAYKNRMAPLFPAYLFNTEIEKTANHFLSPVQFNALLKSYIKRHSIRNDKNTLISITTRRIRYTFACKLVEAGVPRREVAQLLDHSDLQNVVVYFELSSSISKSLKEAAEPFIQNLISKLTGTSNTKTKLEKITPIVSVLPSPCLSCAAFIEYRGQDEPNSAKA